MLEEGLSTELQCTTIHAEGGIAGLDLGLGVDDRSELVAMEES